ncbi:sigma-70 family RNA polymerase sigma factor [Ornithinimicrobium sp. Arc0846-15]|nr:sigma-70 family RNA polymerase sigma factor [Ornithinimicrobium laminariae]
MAAWQRDQEGLLRAARLGDQTAFAEITTEFGPGMVGYAHSLVGNHHDAADVVQEALLSAWRSLDTFRGDSALKTWLYRLVHRRAMDLLRRRRPQPVDVDEFTELTAPTRHDPDRAAEDSEVLAALRAVLSGIPEGQRSVWMLREVEGMSYAEIGDTLALPVDQVRGLLARGRATVTERMQAWR